MSSGVRRRASRALREVLELHPPTYQRFVMARGARIVPVGSSVDLVLCGPAGCGNSFLREAMLAANPGMDIASHMHSWVEIAQARRLGLPAVLVVRDPLDALVSSVLREKEGGDVGALAREHERLLRRVLPLRRDYLLVDFAMATQQVGLVTRAVNHRFGTSFVPFPDDAPSRAQVLATMADYDARQQVSGDPALLTGVPSAVRDGRKAATRAELLRTMGAELARCRTLYAELLATGLDDLSGTSSRIVDLSDAPRVIDLREDADLDDHRRGSRTR